MRNLTKIIAPALVAALGLSAIAPASAQEAPRHETSRYETPRHEAARYTPARNASIRSDINDLRRDIDRAAARNRISQREADGLRREAAGIQRLYANYARGGLSRWETQTLQSKVDRVQVALHAERHDRDGRRG